MSNLLSVLFLLGIPYVANFIHELQEPDHSWLYLVSEAGLLLLVLLGILLLSRELYQRHYINKQLNASLSITRSQLLAVNQQLELLHNKLRQHSRQYGAVIQEQLQVWQLTPSEKEIALLILKGLSFEDIANIRQSKEKTVRQQASMIYRKSGLNGRCEFTAWFFEDFLQ
jgi:DNA-binding CsgD family transcriptional regulator